MSIITDPDLTGLLLHADTEDLSILIDHITDKGEGRISLSSAVCSKLVAAKKAGQVDEEARAFIAEELCRFGGNSLMNLFRGGAGVPYKEIVCDVASHVKANHTSRQDCSQIEMAILLKVLEQSMEKMTEQQKEQLFRELGGNYTVGAGPTAMAAFISALKFSGIGAYNLSAVVANGFSSALLGRGLAFGATAGASRWVSVFTGPIGWTITAIWTAFDLASPAYRVTVPCVVQIAYMRQKKLANHCPECGSSAPANAKFCTNCGCNMKGQDALRVTQ